jgi:hypothetical protein
MYRGMAEVMKEGTTENRENTELRGFGRVFA